MVFGVYVCHIFLISVVKKAENKTMPRFVMFLMVIGMPIKHMGCVFEIDVRKERAKVANLSSSSAREPCGSLEAGIQSNVALHPRKLPV